MCERGLQPSGAADQEDPARVLRGARADQVEMASTYLSGRLDVARAVDLARRRRTSYDQCTGGNLGDHQLRSRADVGPQHAAPDCDATAHLPNPRHAAPRSPGRGLVPADCGCGCGARRRTAPAAARKAKPQLVYAIGRLGVSFVSQARRDSIWRIVNGKTEGDLKPITDASLQDLFKKQPFQAQSVVWTLSRTEVPMYVIVPAGAFAAETYKWLVEEWTDATVEFVSIPGVLAGQVALYDGQIVDAVIPDLRGMYSWETKKYVKAPCATRAGRWTPASATTRSIAR